MASSGVKENVIFVNKHPGVLLFVCLWDTTNCKLVLIADVVAINVLADVIPKVCDRCYCH